MYRSGPDQKIEVGYDQTCPAKSDLFLSISGKRWINGNNVKGILNERNLGKSGLRIITVVGTKVQFSDGDFGYEARIRRDLLDTFSD